MFSILNNEDGLAKKDVQHKVSLFCKSWIWEGSFHVVNLAYTVCHICCLSWWPHRSATTECWPLCVLVQLSMLSCSDTVKILWKHASLKMSWSEKWQMPCTVFSFYGWQELLVVFFVSVHCVTFLVRAIKVFTIFTYLFFK